MREFKVEIGTRRLTAIYDRIRAFPWDALADAGGWSSGASVDFMRDLASYWVDGYDWAEAQAGLNSYPQYLAPIDGVELHLYHVRSPEPSARPLILLHGWPGSVFEFLHLIEPLTDPAAHGGDPADAFHVVVPSIPGYGFSGRPPGPIGPARIASIFSKLMTEVLGYDRYIAQGGDWGSIISTAMARQDAEHCAGIHLNMVIPFGEQPTGDEEITWAKALSENQQREGGYSHLQMTRPQSLAFAMTDSPVGVAAWIIEKFAAWSDLPLNDHGGPDLLAKYTRDQLLTNIMIYLAHDSFATSIWLYRAFANGQAASPFRHADRTEIPTALAAFRDPAYAPAPRSMAERTYNVTRWTDMPRGGHFAALEAPDLLLADLRAFARGLS